MKKHKLLAILWYIKTYINFCRNRVPRTGYGRFEPGNPQEDTSRLHVPFILQPICSARCRGEELPLREVPTRIRLASVFLRSVSMLLAVLLNRVLRGFFFRKFIFYVSQFLFLQRLGLNFVCMCYKSEQYLNYKIFYFVEVK